MAARTYLGTHNNREYYLCPADRDPSKPAVPKHPHLKPYIAWRVPDIREAFLARPGYKLLGGDYNQAEIKIMAFMSQDQALIAAINSGKDIHCYMASVFYGVDYDEFYAQYKDENHSMHDLRVTQRSDIKTTTFGVPYGAGPPRVSAMTGKSVPEADDLIKKYFKTYRALEAWLKYQGSHALAKGWTESLRKRKRFYDLPTMEAIADADSKEKQAEARREKEKKEGQIRRWAGNQPIQTSCVDLLKPAMIKIYLALRGGDPAGELLYDAHLVLSVHDEIVVECADKDVEPVKKIMHDCMQESFFEIIHGINNEVEITEAGYWKK